MLYHELHWVAQGRPEFLLGAAPWSPFEPPLGEGNRLLDDDVVIAIDWS